MGRDLTEPRQDQGSYMKIVIVVAALCLVAIGAFGAYLVER